MGAGFKSVGKGKKKLTKEEQFKQNQKLAPWTIWIGGNIGVDPQAISTWLHSGQGINSPIPGGPPGEPGKVKGGYNFWSNIGLNVGNIFGNKGKGVGGGGLFGGGSNVNKHIGVINPFAIPITGPVVVGRGIGHVLGLGNIPGLKGVFRNPIAGKGPFGLGSVTNLPKPGQPIHVIVEGNIDLNHPFSKGPMPLPKVPFLPTGTTTVQIGTNIGVEGVSQDPIEGLGPEGQWLNPDGSMTYGPDGKVIPRPDPYEGFNNFLKKLKGDPPAPPGPGPGHGPEFNPNYDPAIDDPYAPPTPENPMGGRFYKSSDPNAGEEPPAGNPLSEPWPQPGPWSRLKPNDDEGGGFPYRGETGDTGGGPIGPENDPYLYRGNYGPDGQGGSMYIPKPPTPRKPESDSVGDSKRLGLPSTVDEELRGEGNVPNKGNDSKIVNPPGGLMQDQDQDAGASRMEGPLRDIGPDGWLPTRRGPRGAVGAPGTSGVTGGYGPDGMMTSAERLQRQQAEEQEMKDFLNEEQRLVDEIFRGRSPTAVPEGSFRFDPEPDRSLPGSLESLEWELWNERDKEYNKQFEDPWGKDTEPFDPDKPAPPYDPNTDPELIA